MEAAHVHVFNDRLFKFSVVVLDITQFCHMTLFLMSDALHTIERKCQNSESKKFLQDVVSSQITLTSIRDLGITCCDTAVSRQDNHITLMYQA